MTEEVILGLGSNLGDRYSNILSALRLLKERCADIKRDIKVSRIYENPAVNIDEEDAPDFLNAVCSFHTNLSPKELLKSCKKIEYELGRIVHKSESNEIRSREIDIDILFYGDITLNKKELKIPHEKLYDREFVLIPLGDIIDKNWKDPATKKNYQDLLLNLKINS